MTRFERGLTIAVNCLVPYRKIVVFIAVDVPFVLKDALVDFRRGAAAFLKPFSPENIFVLVN